MALFKSCQFANQASLKSFGAKIQIKWEGEIASLFLKIIAKMRIFSLIIMHFSNPKLMCDIFLYCSAIKKEPSIAFHFPFFDFSFFSSVLSFYEKPTSYVHREKKVTESVNR